MWTRPRPAQDSGDQGRSKRETTRAACCNWISDRSDMRANWPDCEHTMVIRAPTNPRISAARRAGKKWTMPITRTPATPAAASARAAIENTTRVEGGVVMLSRAKPEKQRQCQQADQAEVGDDGLQEFAQEHRPNRNGSREQEVHVAREVERLQQDAEAGQQNPDEGHPHDGHREALRQARHVRD